MKYQINKDLLFFCFGLFLFLLLFFAVVFVFLLLLFFFGGGGGLVGWRISCGTNY